MVPKHAERSPSCNGTFKSLTSSETKKFFPGLYLFRMVSSHFYTHGCHCTWLRFECNGSPIVFNVVYIQDFIEINGNYKIGGLLLLKPVNQAQPGIRSLVVEPRRGHVWHPGRQDGSCLGPLRATWCSLERISPETSGGPSIAGRQD